MFCRGMGEDARRVGPSQWRLNGSVVVEGIASGYTPDRRIVALQCGVIGAANVWAPLLEASKRALNTRRDVALPLSF